MEVVVQIKTSYGKHTLVEEEERRMVKYSPWGKCSQPHIRMEMARRVAPLRFRKVRKERTDSGSSSDSGTWINMAEGFGYPPAIFTDPNYPEISKEGGEGVEPEIHFETHPQNNDCDSTNKSMPEEEALTLEKLKINKGPYCPICTPKGYRCVCKDQESEWDDMVEMNKSIPQARIKRSWFYPEETKKAPHGNMMSNSPRSEKLQTPSEECIESDWDTNLNQVSDYPSRPHADCRKSKTLKRHTQPLRRPLQRWPKDRSTTCCPTPVPSSEYIPMTSLPKTPNPVK